MASSAFSLTDDLPHEDKILDASEPTDDAETREDDLEETAPNWAFASFVTERDELLGIFANLKPIEHSQRITTIIQQYQEQPQLLDPHLAHMTTTLFEFVRKYLAKNLSSGASSTETASSRVASDQEVTHALYIVYHLCKVRGYKTVSKLFPHAVEDLEPTFDLLERFRISPHGVASNPNAISVNDRPITASNKDMSEQKAEDLSRFVSGPASSSSEPASDIHPLVLQAQATTLEDIEWRVPYVLLLWLSVIGLIPFDLNALDNASSRPPDSTLSLKHRLLDTAKHYLRESSITRNASAELLSTLLTRPDMKPELADFLSYASTTVAELATGPSAQLLNSPNQYLIAGLYATLSLIFQKGERERLLPFVRPVLQSFFPASKGASAASEGDSEFELPSNLLINKKMSVKLVQRLGLVLLAPRVPQWRYQRRTVSLLTNLQKTPSQDTSTASTATANSNASSMSIVPTAETEEEYEIPEDLEVFIQLLLSALGDKDTIVRWSAAKGIGRLTHRLSQGLADEIVASLLELFDPRETDCTWHGACLAIAELARRGLLLPSRLPELVPRLTSALQFEIRRGNHTTGHHVRDAACYVAWALARAYDPSLLRDILSVSLAASILLTALFDREVNCRRAAAAAFQEHVGRQGSFPHGIDVITLVNFFTLSNRSDAYLTLAPQVAIHPEYAQPIINHLAFSKCQHVDHTIRDLAAKALGKLVLERQHRQYIFDKVVPKLIPLAVSSDFATRQGAIQALAEVVSNFAQGFVEIQDEEQRDAAISVDLPKATQERICNIPLDVERARLYRGRGSEYLRIAICRLISAISDLGLSLKSIASTSAGAAKTAGPVKGPAVAQRLAAGTPATKSGKDTLTFFIETIEENLRHPMEDVVDFAVAATRKLASRYLPASAPATISLLERWIKVVSTDTNQAARRGHSLALGALPLSTISAQLPAILASLIGATKILGKKHYLDDAEVRKNAVVGLTDLVTRVPLEPELSFAPSPCFLTKSQLLDIINVFFTCMDDYTTDNRGDIGSLVREAAISAVGHAFVKIARFDNISSTRPDAQHDSWLTKDLMMQFVGKLVRLTLEKIDRTRERAGVMFEQLLRSVVGQPSTAGAYKYWKQVNFGDVRLSSDLIPHGNAIWHEIEKASKALDAKSVITGSLNWTSSRVVFPILVPLMKLDEYRYWVNLGIIRSVGGQNNSQELIEDSTSNLMLCLRSLGSLQSLDQYAMTLTNIMKQNVGNEQVITSLWATIDFVFATGLLYPLRAPVSTFAADLLALSRAELRLPSPVSKLTASVPIFAHLLAFEGEDSAEVRASALKMMLFFLSYKYPVIRKLAAENLYLQLESVPQAFTFAPTETEPQPEEKAKEILSTVSWAWDTEYQAAKDSLSLLFGVKNVK